MKNIIPYLNFNGKCSEALNYYKECLGGKLEIMPVKGSPVESQLPEEMRDKVMHASLTGENFTICGSDMSSTDDIFGNAYSIMITCESEDEINKYFKYFSEGSKILCPLRLEFWGDWFAELVDKFGIRWKFVYGKSN